MMRDYFKTAPCNIVFFRQLQSQEHGPLLPKIEPVSRSIGLDTKRLCIRQTSRIDTDAQIKALDYQVYLKSKAWINSLPKTLAAFLLGIFTPVKLMHGLLAPGERESGSLVDAMVSAAQQEKSPIKLSEI